MIIVDGLEPIAGRKIQFDAAAAAWSAPALTRDTRPWRGHGTAVLEVSREPSSSFTVPGKEPIKTLS